MVPAGSTSTRTAYIWSQWLVLRGLHRWELTMACTPGFPLIKSCSSVGDRGVSRNYPFLMQLSLKVCVYVCLRMHVVLLTNSISHFTCGLIHPLKGSICWLEHEKVISKEQKINESRQWYFHSLVQYNTLSFAQSGIELKLTLQLPRVFKWWEAQLICMCERKPFTSKC